LQGISRGPKAIGRKLRALTTQIVVQGAAIALPRAYTRLNKLDIVQFGIRGAILPFRVRTLKEARGPAPGADDVVVLSVLRNGLPWLDTFLSHHRALGARRFIILDNGSTDGSREYLMSQDDVVLLASNAPYRHYENTFKRYICDRFAKGRWCLFVDVDELVAYPGMSQRSLADLARFTWESGFSAVITQMLDLYSDVPMADMPDGTGRDLRVLCRFYETQDIEWAPYVQRESNSVPDNARLHFGGVRSRVFGTRNCLTKTSLFFNGEGLVPFHRWHHTRNARLADFSIALLHYPFNRQYREKVLEAAASGRYGWVTSDEYQAYAAVMRDNPRLSMMSEASRLYQAPEQLVAERFLEASPSFRQWAGMSNSDYSKQREI